MRASVLLCALGVASAVGPAAPGQALPFTPFQASDFTFSVYLPPRWQPAAKGCPAWAPWVESFAAVSPYGESFTEGVNRVFLAPDVVQGAVQVLQQAGCPPATLVLVGRDVSPPLRPAGVIGYLLPQLAHGAIQNMTILWAKETPLLSNPSTLTRRVTPNCFN